MQTLRERALSTILKYGIGPRIILPKPLQKEIESMEETIQLDLVGSNYYEYHRVLDCLEFDISWHVGTWTLSQRWEFGQHKNSTIHISAGRESFISPLWKDIFSLPDI